MKTGLVLGGGGLVGMAYHAGALKALQMRGVDVSGADLIVGTSAGSITGAYLACGWSPGDFYDYAHGRHADVSKDPDDEAEAVRQLFDPLWGSALERMQRSIGSIFALGSSRGYWRGGKKGKLPSSRLRRLFPSGLYSTEGMRERLRDDLPAEWPTRGLYICAADLYSGDLVAFGRAGAPPAPLPDAVLASCAIPGFFPPVKVGGRHYVDGGAISATSLHLAAKDACDRILCIAPLGYRGAGAALDPKLLPAMAMRQFFARALRREVKQARATGCDVLVIRPWVEELKELGTNAMRHFDRRLVTDTARDGVLRFLDQEAEHPVIKAFTVRPEERVG